MNVTTVKCLQANQMIVTHQVRHIFTPIDKTTKKYFISCNNFLNVTIQSHPIRKDCYKPNEKCWIVATVNPISHSHPVHHGTFFNVLIHNFIAVMQAKHHLTQLILKTKHKQSNTLSCITIKYSFLLIEIRYFILLAINTHIDHSNNSKCSVRYIFKATARSLKSVSLCMFC